LASIKIVPDCSAEGLALFLYQKVNGMLTINFPFPGCVAYDQLKDYQARNVRIYSVTVAEDFKNAAYYREDA
jgi:hypothetical protein